MKRVIKTAITIIVAVILLVPISIASAAMENSAISSYYKRGTLIAAPAVVSRVKGLEDLLPFKGTVTGNTVRPSNMILNIDENMSVIGQSGEILGDFEELYVQYLKNKIIPVVNVTTSEQATAFAAYIKQKGYVDFAVASPDAALLSAVKTEYPYIRGILDYSGQDIDGVSAGKLANIVSENKAITVILSQSQAAQKYVFDVQAMLKSVWIEADSSQDMDLHGAVSAGAYGIICDDYAKLYQIFEGYPANSLSRGFYNVAHRGLSEKYAENTLQACIGAYEAGATHVEVDAKICKTGEIVILHDDTLEGKTNGSGNINDKTLAQLKQIQVIKNTSGKTVAAQPIPSLREIFEFFKSKDIVIMVEIKNEHADFAAKLKALIEEFDIADQVVVISFSYTQLRRMAEVLPEIPIADLNSTNRDSLIGYMNIINSLNSGIDPEKSSIVSSLYMFGNMINRGYLLYYWTQYTAAETIKAINDGCAGIVTNHADALSGYVKILEAEGDYSSGAAALYSGEFAAKALLYNGQITDVKAKVFKAEVFEDYAVAVLMYTQNGLTNYSQPVYIDLSEQSSPTPSESPGETDGPQNSDAPSDNIKKGCGSYTSVHVILATALCLGAAVILKKYRLGRQ